MAAAGRVGEYSHAMIQTIEEPADETKEFQDVLVQLAKAVATSTAQLVLKAKTVSSQCEDPGLQDQIVHTATQCAFATSQLVACARVVAPTIDSPACQEQLTDAVKQVAKAVEDLLKDAELACKDERTHGDLRDAAAQVTRSLNDLLGHIRTGPQQARVTRQDQELETIITSTDRLISYSGSANEMVRQAKVLAEATTHLVSHIRGEADDQRDTEDRDKLLGAARKVANATTSMIEAAKLTAVSPQTAEHQIALRAAAEDLQSATKDATAAQLRRRALLRLEQAARNTAASATQTIAAANASEPSNKNPQSVQGLSVRCQETAEFVPPMIAAVRQSQANPDDELVQTELLRVSSEMLNPAGQLIQSSRSAVPTVTDQSASMHLSNTTQQLSENLSELRTCVTIFQEMLGGGNDLDNAIRVVKGLNGELADFQRAARDGRMQPVPGETAERSSAQLISSTKSVGSAMAQMLSAAAQGDAQYAGLKPERPRRG